MVAYYTISESATHGEHLAKKPGLNLCNVLFIFLTIFSYFTGEKIFQETLSKMGLRIALLLKNSLVREGLEVINEC